MVELSEVALAIAFVVILVVLVVYERVVLCKLYWFLNGLLWAVLEFRKRAFRMEGNLVHCACQHSLASVHFAFQGQRRLHQVRSLEVLLTNSLLIWGRQVFPSVVFQVVVIFLDYGVSLVKAAMWRLGLESVVNKSFLRKSHRTLVAAL